MNTKFNNLSRKYKNFYGKAMKAYRTQTGISIKAMKYLFSDFNTGQHGSVMTPRGHICYLEVPTSRGYVMMGFTVVSEQYMFNGKIRIRRAWTAY